jgi:DNA-binding transcriptional MocR family regulator
VTEAYRLLEDQGRIEARPQSGYYVLAVSPAQLPEPEISRPAGGPTPVTVSALVRALLRDSCTPGLMQLGTAMANPALLPVDRLHRALTTASRRYPARGVCYAPPSGDVGLRVQIARRALVAGCTLAPDEILVTCGCQEANMLCLQAVCRPGDTVAVESPMYYGSLEVLETLGLRALEIPSHPRDGMSLEALRYAMDETPIQAVHLVTNFSNPLGSCMPDERKRELVELLAEREIPLVEDDIFGEIGYAPDRPKVAKAFDRKGLVLLCSSFSKTIAPGYRVGYTAPGRYLPDVERLKFVNNLATATLPQIAVAEFLTNGGYERHLRRIRRVYARQVAEMGQAVMSHFPPGTKVTRPAGGFVIWVELPPSVDSLDLYERGLTRGVTFAPGPMFSAKQKYRNFVRLNAAFWSERVAGGIATLGELARELYQERA